MSVTPKAMEMRTPKIIVNKKLPFTFLTNRISPTSSVAKSVNGTG